MHIIASCLAALLLLSVPTYASRPKNCDPSLRSNIPALTLRQIRERSMARTAKLQLVTPAPAFEDLSVQANIEQVGEQGPEAFQQLLPHSVSFVNTPSPTSVDPTAVDLVDEGRSIPVHVDVPWDGRRTSTAAWVSLPKARTASTSKFLVGPEYPVVILHLHGGGTPTATGRNGMSIAKEVGKRGIPLIGLDLPGHGRATRNPEGLETFKKQADWVMKAAKQLVDPRVKIVLSGHSWGGEFALFMYYLSQDPNYSRISQFISLSPPIDVSLGGTLREKLEFEERYEREFEQFKDRIAAADFEFHSHLVDNGKISDVGSFFTTLSNLDYRTPELTPEEQAKRKKLTVVVGSADGMVYVGREEQFQRALNGLTGGNEFILLGPGRTWKSKRPDDLYPTGHNIFDRYADGTTTLQTYKLIGDKVLEGGPDLDTTESTGQASLDLVERAFRHYANFIGFREMLKDRVEFVTTDTEHRAPTSKRKGELDEYLRRVDEIEAQIQKINDPNQIPPVVTKALESLRARLGITDNLNAARAREELALVEPTPERRATLQAYIAEVSRKEGELRANFSDEQYEQDLAQMNEEFKPLLQKIGISSVTDYSEKYKEFQRAPKNGADDRARLRSELEKLHQRMIALNRGRENRFGVARDALLSRIATPSGVRDQRSARRELDADYSPARRQSLKAFLAEAERVEAQAKQAAIDELRAKIETQARPSGIRTPEQARGMKAQLEDYLNFTFVPPGNPEIAQLAEDIRALSAEVSELSGGGDSALSLDKLEASVKTLRGKRASRLKAWEGLWKSEQLTSPNVAKYARTAALTLESYKSQFFTYESKKSAFLLALKESGRLTAANILALTPELKEHQHRLQRAKQVFHESRAQLESARTMEAILGRLTGPENMVKEAHEIALELWGQEYPSTRRPGANSLTQSLKVEEEYLFSRQEQALEREQELNTLRARYSTAMLALGQPVPFRVQRVDLSRLFHQPLQAVVTQLNTQPATATALTQLLSKWEQYQARLRQESQTKDTSSY